MSQAATSPNSYQNPKSILADKNHYGTGGTTTDNGLHVTFARLTSPKTNNTSLASMMSNQPQSSISKPKLSPLRRRTDDSDGVSRRYAPGSSDVKRMSERTEPLSEGNRLRSKSRSRPLEVIQESEVLSQKRSEESIGSIKSTSTRKGEKSSKSRKHTKVSVAKAASKNTTSDSFKRSKPKKKLKKRMKATVAANDAQENDMDAFKPAKLNEEYASELGKITQILRAVSIFDASTSSPPVHTIHKVTLGSQDGRTGASGIHGESPRRPLSAVELKQLLSSITRVVSLHQLPINGPPPGHQDNAMTSSQAPTTTSAANPTRKSYTSDNMSSAIGENSEVSQNLKKKKSKRVKLASFVGSYGEKEVNKTKSRSSSKPKTSRASVRKPRSKQPRERKITSGRARSEGGSSVSSTEKDPVQNAAFLRKYFEESTRLANQVSDEDLNLDESKPKKKKGKKKKGSSKKLSKKSSAVEKKSSQQSMQASTEQPKSELGGGAGGGATGSDNAGKDISNEITIQENLVPTIRQLLDSAYAQINPDHKGESSKKGGGNRDSNKSSSSNVSSTGGPVIGGKRPISSPNNSKKGTSEIKLRPSRFLKSERSNSRVRSKSNGPSEGGTREQANDLMDMLVKRFGREEGNTVQFRTGANNASPKSQNVDPMKNSGSVRTPIKQFETIEDVINSKFSGDTSKMKSIWDKTPYQPMTHERFKDLVSMYASTKTTTDDYIISEERRRKQKTPVIPPTDNQITSKPGGGKAAPFSSNKPGVGNLLTLPKSWEIEEHTMELSKREPTITQLQPPPRSWAESEATSTYNRINFDFNDELDSMRQTERTKQKLQEQTARQRKYHMKGPIGGPYINLNAPKDFDIFTLYKDAMKKQENR